MKAQKTFFVFSTGIYTYIYIKEIPRALKTSDLVKQKLDGGSNQNAVGRIHLLQLISVI